MDGTGEQRHEDLGGFERLRVEIRGAVQGVGFRPFVYRLARELGLAGWVLNDARGVFVEVEGARPALERFLARLDAEAPPRSRIHALEPSWLAPAGFTGFEIRHSDEAGARTAVLLPDLATCADCLAETLEPSGRRHRYPFTNCTNCGPRFTIIRELPYDRPHTTMSAFALCERCADEYGDPLDRRFHAQPIACPACGPRLRLADSTGGTLADGDSALRLAAAAIRDGRIVAVKGLGGFHLMCDAANEAAIATLRARKAREEKPLALLCRDLEGAAALCEVDEPAARVLGSSECPIVLLPRRAAAPVAANVAPGLTHLGVMLPATPLHHLLMAEVGAAVVATSGNLSDEPIATANDEARTRLAGIADLFLEHDRPIERHVDDSIGWFVAGEFRLLRRARGFAPLPVRLARPWPTILAVGAHLKNTVALAAGEQVFVSQHIGDLETLEANAAFERVIADFLRLYDARPAAIAHDLHPDYLSTQWARVAAERLGARLVGVQHHHAHLAACLAEHGAEGPALGVTWDGTGHGLDGTVWGGEFLLGDALGFERVAHLRPFRLPGGERAVREPRRTAIGLLWELLGPDTFEREDLDPVASFPAAERAMLRQLLEKDVHAPVTTSAGRLFDGLAALAGLGRRTSFEGQTAMKLEFAADPAERGAYPVTVSRAVPAGPLVLDWRPMLAATLDDLAAGRPAAAIAARVHNGLVAGIAAVAREVGAGRVVLSGGCFQNRRLTEGALAALAADGREVLMHRQVPPNDGGVSLGQAAVAAARLARE